MSLGLGLLKTALAFVASGILLLGEKPVHIGAFVQEPPLHVCVSVRQRHHNHYYLLLLYHTLSTMSYKLRHSISRTHSLAQRVIIACSIVL